MCSFLSLPIEILHDIQLLSGSEDLPLVCKRLFRIYSSTTSDRHKAIFLWRRYPREKLPTCEDFKTSHLSSDEKVEHAALLRRENRRKWVQYDLRRLEAMVKYRICTIPVLRILQKFIFDDLPLSKKHKEKFQFRIRQIPTRLFKHLPTSPNNQSTSTDINQAEQLDYSYQFIELLLTEFGASPDKIGGFPLARSALSGNLKFIRLLLNHGARPKTNYNLAIRVAIEIGNLEILKLLIEPDYIHPNETNENNPFNVIHSKIDSTSSFNIHLSHQTLNETNIEDKKNRSIGLEDRVKLTDEMLDELLEESARRNYPSIFQYLLQKGAKPTLETIRLIESMEMKSPSS